LSLLDDCEDWGAMKLQDWTLHDGFPVTDIVGLDIDGLDIDRLDN